MNYTTICDNKLVARAILQSGDFHEIDRSQSYDHSRLKETQDITLLKDECGEWYIVERDSEAGTYCVMQFEGEEGAREYFEDRGEFYDGTF